MSAFERALLPGGTESPECRCGKKMRTASADPFLGKRDTHIRVYDCPVCHHEMRLTVWGADALS
jgi:hypothetical protein